MESEVVDRFLEQWHRIIREKDPTGFAALLSDDVKIGPPPYWNRLEGKNAVAFLLGVILETIENFEYKRQWRDGGELALEFTGSVEGKPLQGIDLITVGDDGLLHEIDVPMRPVGTVNVLIEKVTPRMTAYFESLAGDAKGDAP